MSAIRLTFDVVDGKPTLKTSRRLKMRVPPQQRHAKTDTGFGLWIELRDRDGKVVYCRILHSEALAPNVEHSTGASDQRFTRPDAKKLRSMFNAVVPDTPDVASFHIMERKSGKAGAKPKEIFAMEIETSR